MNAIASTKFVSTAHKGENWRDISKKVLEDIVAMKTDGFKPNIGFLYITDALTADAGSILTLFKSVTGIEHWTGCSALGVCGVGEEFVGTAAISVLIGEVPANAFHGFSTGGPNFKQLHKDLEPWLNKNDPMLVIAHVDPMVDKHPAQALEEIDVLVGGFLTGGMASSQQGEPVIFSHNAHRGGVSGFIFSQDIQVATSLSQGCIPMGELHEVSKDGDHIIAYLDGKTPFDVFGEDMRSFAKERLGYNAEEAIMKGMPLPESLAQLLQGTAHVAFPVAGSDQNDFMVRNIMAIDPETGRIAVSEFLEDGQKIMFVHRDDETVRSDLSQTLVALRKRIMHERGGFAPKAAIYITCVARADVAFDEGEKTGGEMALIREILGDIPMAGFYGSGEIMGNRLYGYTGIITLFL